MTMYAVLQASLQAVYENIPSTYKMNNVTLPALQRLSPPRPLVGSPSASAAASLLSHWHRSSPSKRPSSNLLPAAKLQKREEIIKIFIINVKNTRWSIWLYTTAAFEQPVSLISKSWFLWLWYVGTVKRQSVFMKSQSLEHFIEFTVWHFNALLKPQ